MKEEILVDLGLNKNEAKVYLSLLHIGLSTAGIVSQECKLHRTNVYDALNKLVNKGLVSTVIKGEVKYFQASHPNNLMNMVAEKEQKLKQILPQLLLDHDIAQDKSEVRLYHGLLAAKSTLINMLRHNKPIYSLGTTKETSELANPFLAQFHKQRVAKRIHMYHIYNDDAIERIKWLNSLPYTEAYVLPHEFNAPISTTICGDEVVLKKWSKNAITIQIINPEIADVYQKYFMLLRGLAKKPA